MRDSAGGARRRGRRGDLRDRRRGEVRGRDLWLHHQHQVQQVAKGGVQRAEDPGEEVHT